ncbi:NAD(P)/FAD-dependent oxidoreductase [Dolichospermum flos-aquae]|uniref:FAD-binding oxidoreductase n=1 Tax=Dolichospermum flos-aquae CCAP 1403/13F TaxID=315271 RepID=A0A6H2BVP8_DOLFA|nr:FAD-binding oxidoreductase [Dolichospermum flos-aquae]QJB43655.1 FAD-binding oxidoreductase [Dolichospermum flos-aquae CCAP 1403/13F]
MKTYDWIIIGAGITGAALAYELTKIGFSVLLLEQYQTPQNATCYSYGGISFWSATTAITKQLSTEGLTRHRILSEELNADTQFRELDLLMTISVDINPEIMAKSYQDVVIPPHLISIQEACELEPFLNPEAISGALTVKHGHVHPEKTTQAYIQAMVNLGGEIQFGEFRELVTTSTKKCTGVKTNTNTFQSDNVVICAGGITRKLLKSMGIAAKIYFSHAEIIEIPSTDIQLHSLVSPANLQRFQQEAESTQIDELWDNPNHEILSPILDAGVVQFLDGSLRIGQISRVLTNPQAAINSTASEQWLRESITNILPSLGNLPGTWHHCLVAFTQDKLPLIGAISEFSGLHIFSGFSSPFLFVPPLAVRFANFVSGQKDEIIKQMSPDR